MANLRQARRRMIVVLGVFLAVDVACAAIMLTPLGGAYRVRQREFDTVRKQFQTKKNIVVPPDQMQQRVEEARKQIDAFYQDRLAGGSAALTAELGRLAASSGVSLNSAKYDELDSDLPGLRHLHIEANVTGDYLQEVKFINSVERDKMFFIIDSVSLGEQQAGTVRLQVGLETYLKGEAE
jgi:Tfp pilus assembly protein PilO